jgi:hypothetical protein
MTDRDEAVRVMAETLHNRPGGCGAWKCADPVGHATAYIYRDTASDVLDALIAAGWGDLTAERERADVADSLTRTVIAAREHAERTLTAERDEARAEVERLREQVDHPQGGAGLGITWPIDRLAPDGIPWIEHYSAASQALDKVTRERDEARAAIARVEALCDEADDEFSASDHAWDHWVDSGAIRAALRGDQP